MITIKKSEFAKLYNIACSNWKPKLEEKFKGFVFSDSLEFDKSFLEEMKSACTEEQLKIFNVIFKDYVQETQNLFDKIKNYSDVCKELNEREESDPIKKIKQIAKLFNGDWRVNFNGSQRNWYPYFHYSGGGCRFDGSGCRDVRFYGMVSYYKDEKTSNFVGKTFSDVYMELKNSY